MVPACKKFFFSSFLIRRDYGYLSEVHSHVNLLEAPINFFFSHLLTFNIFFWQKHVKVLVESECQLNQWCSYFILIL